MVINELILIIGAGVFVILLLIALYRNNMKKLLKDIVLSLVVKAEKELGSGTGEFKYSLVVNNLFSLIPKSLQFLLTKKDIDNLIEEAVYKLKEFLSKGGNLLQYEEELKNFKFDNENF